MWEFVNELFAGERTFGLSCVSSHQQGLLTTPAEPQWTLSRCVKDAGTLECLYCKRMEITAKRNNRTDGPKMSAEETKAVKPNLGSQTRFPPSTVEKEYVTALSNSFSFPSWLCSS